MDVRPGEFVAQKYRVVRMIGQGAMGSVFEAVHALTERSVALKVLAEDLKTAEMRARLLREARACGRIQHRNVIEVFDVGELEDGRPFLVMPLLSGETLEGRIDREGALSEEVALDVAMGVAKALVAAHDLGIVHRDLKPGNVFLHHEDASGVITPKVLDFGISKILSRDEASFTDAGRAVGSPAYMSPEQAQGLADLDARTDVWSFGVMLAEMLSGNLPFEGDTPYAIVGNIIHGSLPDFDAVCPNASPALRALMRRTVLRDRSVRLGSARELVAALEAARRDPSDVTLGSAAVPAEPRATAVPPAPVSQPRAQQPSPSSPRIGAVTMSALETQKIDIQGPRRGSRVAGIIAASALVTIALVIGGFVWSRPASTAATTVEARGSAVVPTAPTDAPSAPAEVTANAAATATAQTTASAPRVETAEPSAMPPTTPTRPAVRPYSRPAPRPKTTATSRVALPDSPG
jgi:serine/threonine-protein kinase